MKKSALLSKLEEKKTAKKKLKKPPTEKRYDEEIYELGAQLRIDPKTVHQALQGLLKFTTENPKLKNQLFDDEQFPVFLQINTIKVSSGHSKILRIPLKHSFLTPDSEVCLIVPDVKGLPNKNHEQHLEHYEKLLNEKNVTNIKKIMTFHEFRTEYEAFELKSRLVELYDAFLVDGRISGKTVKKCGKIFYKKRKVPTAVKLQATKLKEHIEQNLAKTALYFHGNGDSFVVQVGHSKMPVRNIVENVFYVGKGLEKDFPGGFDNVRTVSLFAHRGLHIPIYSTLKNQNDVDLMKNVEKKETREPATGELTTRLNRGVRVSATGEVEVYKLKQRKKK